MSSLEYVTLRYSVFFFSCRSGVLIRNRSNDTHVALCDCRKSFKSLLFLLPLLGITNILHHVWPNPLRGSWVFFAVWSITTHFLYSFQGRDRSCPVMVVLATFICVLTVSPKQWLANLLSKVAWFLFGCNRESRNLEQGIQPCV